MKKERIDVLLVDKGHFETREQAKRAIMAGLIQVEQQVIDKPGTKIPIESNILVKGDLHPYVSRGGLKLEKAIEKFKIDLKDKIVLDIGASTGGFTDCSLQNGAKEVYAIDVGYGQLAWTLRQDERVHVMERTNFRYLTVGDLKSSVPNFATIDVSFISLRIILDTLKRILAPMGEVVALIKPQFEAGKEHVGKKGIIKDPKVHHKVLEDIILFAVQSGYTFLDLTYSPIKGGEGNIEFLLYLQNSPTTDITYSIDEISNKAKSVINEAQQSLTS